MHGHNPSPVFAQAKLYLFIFTFHFGQIVFVFMYFHFSSRPNWLCIYVFLLSFWPNCLCIYVFPLFILARLSLYLCIFTFHFGQVIFNFSIYPDFFLLFPLRIVSILIPSLQNRRNTIAKDTKIHLNTQPNKWSYRITELDQYIQIENYIVEDLRNMSEVVGWLTCPSVGF